MHQVLFLFFCILFFYPAKFLDTDQEKQGFHIGFLAKSLYHFCFQLPPSLLQVVICEHSANLRTPGKGEQGMLNKELRITSTILVPCSAFCNPFRYLPKFSFGCCSYRCCDKIPRLL